MDYIDAYKELTATQKAFLDSLPTVMSEDELDKAQDHLDKLHNANLDKRYISRGFYEAARKDTARLKLKKMVGLDPRKSNPQELVSNFPNLL